MSEAVHVQKAAQGVLQQVIEVHGHHFFADVAEALGGEGAGPDPHELLDAALGACTALTVTMVARRKQIPLEDLRVTISHVEADGLYRLQRRLTFVGPLSAEQREYLTGIANKCPIHRALSGRFEVETSVEPAVAT